MRFPSQALVPAPDGVFCKAMRWSYDASSGFAQISVDTGGEDALTLLLSFRFLASTTHSMHLE